MVSETANIASELVRVVILLGSAMVFVPLFKKLGLGSVLGYLAAGLVIGPFGLQLFSDPHAIIHIAELGVVMFLFIIGLEMKPSHLWALRRQIFGIGAAQVGLATLALTAAGLMFDNITLAVAFVCAAGFVLTSTAIVMQVLGEKNELSTAPGQTMVSILLFEDLMIVPLLAVVNFLAPVSHNDGQSLWMSIGTALAAVILLLLAGRFLLNPLFRLLAKTKLREIMTAAALFVVLGSALLMEEAGLSMAMGAFMAGVLLSESSFRHQLEADIEPFRGLLLGLFFLGVGMSLDLGVVAKNWQLIAVGVLVLMVAKALCIFIIAKLSKQSTKIALERAVLMAQGGEFAFVLFSAAATQGLLDATIHANMTAVVVLSMVLTPLYWVLYEKFIALRFANSGERSPDTIIDENPIIIIGMGRFGQIVSDILMLAGEKLTIIDQDATMADGMSKHVVKTYFGDGSRPEILIAAGIEHAKMLIIAIDNTAQTVKIAEFAKKINPNLYIVARVRNRAHVYDSLEVGADLVVRETFHSALYTGGQVLAHLGIEQEKVDKITNLFNQRDHYILYKMASQYDPKLGLFKNRQIIDSYRNFSRETGELVQDILQGTDTNWQEGEWSQDRWRTPEKA